MPKFKINELFKITDRGYVLSGHLVGAGIVLTGDNLLFGSDLEAVVLKVIGIHPQNEPSHYGLLISFTDFDKLPKDEIVGKEIKIVNVAERKSLTKQPIKWRGDMDDDCTANWAGLMLRAEWMDKDYWWWAVYDMENNGVTVESSNYYETPFIGGPESRKKAESIARKYLNAD